MDLNSISKVLIVKLIDLKFFVRIPSALVLIFFVCNSVTRKVELTVQIQKTEQQKLKNHQMSVASIFQSATKIKTVFFILNLLKIFYVTCYISN